MQVLKICFRSDYELSGLIERIVNNMSENSMQVHIQQIDNTPYLRWLQNMKIMTWKVIVDIIWNNNDFSADEVFKDIFEWLKKWAFPITDVDCYSGTQVVYQNPVSGSELITSCYLWNYNNQSSFREEKMSEHFVMEQKQKYYDYVAFQSINKVFTSDSPKFDFFFESHVSKPEGINEIYSKPALEGMREHSQAFLDVSTRELSFGKVFCYGV